MDYQLFHMAWKGILKMIKKYYCYTIRWTYEYIYIYIYIKEWFDIGNIFWKNIYNNINFIDIYIFFLLLFIIIVIVIIITNVLKYYNEIIIYT